MSSSSSSTSSLDDNDEMAISLLLSCAAFDQQTTAPKRIGGSRPERRGNRNIQREGGAYRLDLDYFCRDRPEEPIFQVQEFDRRFTISRTIYENIRAAVCTFDAYFIQREHCCPRKGARTDQKICAALRLLSTGAASDTRVDYFHLSETTILISLTRFCKAIVTFFKDNYLRRPDPSDIKLIEAQYAKLGFPGSLGCLDCSGWQWDNCPVAFQGQFTGKESKPTIRMEVVCEDHLWVWHLMFGVPGAKNDKSILNQSTLFNDIRSGNWPLLKPEMNIGGTIIDWFYFLADGIYPKFQIFAKPHSDPHTSKAKLYSASHSSARKSVESVFGVLDAELEIIHIPACLSDLCVLNDIVHACVIMQNMIVEERGYNGTAKFRIDEDMHQTLPSKFNDVQQRAQRNYEQAALRRAERDNMERGFG